jgi:hypothetical protein
VALLDQFSAKPLQARFEHIEDGKVTRRFRATLILSLSDDLVRILVVSHPYKLGVPQVIGIRPFKKRSEYERSARISEQTFLLRRIALLKPLSSLYFVALLAARAFAASEIFFLVAADILRFFGETTVGTTDIDFFAEVFFAAFAAFTGADADRVYFLFPRGTEGTFTGELCSNESRIWVSRSISLFSSATAPGMLMHPP